MRAQNQQQRQPCRHGLNCRYLLTNNCRFYHPPPYAPTHTYTSQTHNRSTSRPKQHHNHPSTTNNHSSHTFNVKNKDDMKKILCKDYHMGHCKYADKC